MLASGLMVMGVGVSAASAHPATGDWRGNDTVCQASWCVRRCNLVASAGEVGPDTWGRAHTRTGNGWSQVDGNGVTWWYRAYGKDATLWLRRNASTDVWQFKHPVTGTWTSTGH